MANCTTTSDSRSPVADGSISVVHGLAPRRRSHIFAHTGKENHGRKPRARPPLDHPDGFGTELTGAVFPLAPLIYSRRAPSSITSTVKIHWIQNAEFQQPPASVDEPEVREQGGAASGAGRAGQAPGGA